VLCVLLSPIILWIICKIEDYFISLQAKFSAFMERMNNIFEKLGRKVSEEDKPYVWAKVAQSVYFCIYGITLLVSYLFRVVGLATFIESYALLRPCLFLALYLYMQFDRTDERILPPKRLYFVLRILAFAVMLNVLSDTAFNAFLFTMAIAALYVLFVVAEFKQLRPAIYLFTPTLLALIVYCALTISHVDQWGFDVIAGSVMLISVFVKISIWSFLERGAIQYASDYNRKAMDYSEQLSQEKSKNICRKIRNPWRDGYKSGMFAFCMNAGPLTKIFHEVEDVTIGQDDQMD
jgi:hypothetical protein